MVLKVGLGDVKSGDTEGEDHNKTGKGKTNPVPSIYIKSSVV